MEGAHRSQRLTIAVAQPLVAGGAHLFDVSVEINRYAHTQSAFGGYDQASFSLTEPDPILSDWFENGLGRSITVYDDTLSVIWEGFVNEVAVRHGGLELTYGPLMDVVNRAEVVYSTVDTTSTPPMVGVRARTGTVDHVESQARWGVWPRVISSHGSTPENALALRDLYIESHREPEVSSTYRASGGPSAVSVNCRGYMHTLHWPYRQTAQGGLTTVDAKIASILAADPNGWVSADTARVDANALEVSRWENSDHTAHALLRGLTALGDNQLRRRIFGVWEDRRAVYRPMPTEWAYEVRLNDPRGAITGRTGQELPPWAVRAGEWVFVSDLLPGRVMGDVPIEADPRMIFIESVAYSMPQGLEVSGGKVTRLAQKIAQMGLGGMAV